MRVNLLKLLALTAVISIAVMACAAQETETRAAQAGPEGELIRIAGAGGTSSVLMELADEYSRTNSNVSFRFLEGSGSGGGVKGVNAKLLDLGAMSRTPKESEFETGICYIPFAQERVAVVTSPDIPLPKLTIEQVRAIFTGEFDNWSYVGGPDAPIRLITREEDDSNTKIIRAGILGDAPFGGSAVVMTSETDAKNALNDATYAIGYLAYSGIVAGSRSVFPVALDGQHPADADNDYPLEHRSLGVAFLPENQPKLQGFVDFITGPGVQRFLAQQGLLAVR